MNDLRGKVAAVAGGASGIGPGVARALFAEGMKVALAARGDRRIVTAGAGLPGLVARSAPTVGEA